MVGLPRCSALVGILALLEATFVAYIYSQTSSRSASVGGRQVLNCMSYPDELTLPYIVQWKKEGVKDPVFIQYDNYPPHMDRAYRSRVRLLEQGGLELSQIRPEDEGWYECKIILLDGKEDASVNGSWVHLNVNTPPRIVNSSPKFLLLRQGDSVSLFCDGVGSPQPTISWSKDARPVFSSLRLRLQGDHVNITNIQRSDGGVYMCTFTNTVGQISQLIKLVIEGGTYISTHPQNKTAIEGQRVSFDCAADAYPNNITFTWLHNGVRVQDRPDFPQRIQVEYEAELRSTLIIPSVAKKDMGLYTCRPSNGISEVKETAAYLNVTYLPRVLPMPSQLFLPLGSPAQIPCPIDSNPPVTHILWTKNGRDLDPNSRRLSLQNDGSLIIVNVELTDAGSYSCTPQNNLGQGTSSLIVQVIVRNPPQFTISPDKHYQKTPSQSVTMPCAATGSPVPSITWKKDGRSLALKDRIRQVGGNLTISNLQKADYGQYECIATNTITSIVRLTTLYIEGTTPHAPRNLTISMGLFHARVGWAPAYDGGSEQHYILWYRNTRMATSEWQTMPVPDSSTSITVYNLEPDSLYEFYVLSRNIKGNGMPSVVIRARTLGYVEGVATALPTKANNVTYIPPLVRSIGPQPSPPRNVSAKLIEAGKVNISWAPPLNSTVPVFYYVIQSRQEEGNWQQIHNNKIKVPQTFYTWVSMKRGVTYEIRVLAFGVLAYSLPSNAVSVYVPAPPAVVRGTDSTTSSSSSSNSSGGVTWPVIGAIIGAIAFLLVAILLAVIACLCSRRRERDRTKKYDNVRYTGPKYNLEDTVIREDPSERDQWQSSRRGDSLIHSNIYLVSQPQTEYNDDNGFLGLVSRGPMDPRYSFHDDLHRVRGQPSPAPLVGLYPGENEASLSVDSIDPFRGSQRRSPYERDTSPYERERTPRERDRDRSLYDRTLTPRDRSRSDTVRSRSHSRSPHRGQRSQSGDSYPGPNYEEPSAIVRPEEDYVGGPSPRTPSVFGGYDGPYHSLYSPEGDRTDSAAPHHPSRPGFPRHSSMKPSGHKTYLTGDPEPAPWRLDSDLSSVLPDPSQGPYPSTMSETQLHDPAQSPYQDVSSLPLRIPTPRSPFPRSTGITPIKPAPIRVPKHMADEGYMTPDQSHYDDSRRPDHRLSSNYTRDRLQGTVDKVRRMPRARRGRGRPGSGDHDGYTDRSQAYTPPPGHQSPASGLGTSHDDSSMRRDSDRLSQPFHPQPYGYARDIAPYKGVGEKRTSLSSSGRGSSVGRGKPYWDPYRRAYGDTQPDSFSQSSGIGSRNISQSTGSSGPGRPQKGSTSVSSLATHQEHDISMDSSPFADASGNHRKDVSGDENYEFDTTHPTDSDIADVLSGHRSPGVEFQIPGRPYTSPQEFYSELYPKPRRQSAYSDSEKRFERLRGEFQEFRRRQQERLIQERMVEQRRVTAMDSEML